MSRLEIEMKIRLFFLSEDSLSSVLSEKVDYESYMINSNYEKINSFEETISIAQRSQTSIENVYQGNVFLSFSFFFFTFERSINEGCDASNRHRFCQKKIKVQTRKSTNKFLDLFIFFSFSNF